MAFGRPWDDPDADHPWVDVDGAAGAELATDHLLDTGHTRIAWIGWRKDSCIGEDRRSGWTRAMHARDLPTTGLASRVEDTVASGREAAAGAARRGAAVGVRLRLRHPGDGRAAHARATAACTRARTSPSSASTTPRSPRSCPAGLTSVRQPLEQVAVEVVRALEGLLGHPPVGVPGVLLTPDARRRAGSQPADWR